MNTESKYRKTPSHLREQFQQWLDTYEPDRIQEIDIRPVASLLKALEDCGDVLPADYCDQLEIPKGSTYAEAVEDVRQWCSKQRNGDSKRGADEVYWEYVDKAGEEACAHAVIAYFDRAAVVEILLEHINAEELDEFLCDNVSAE
jgi:hypothetical protein